MNAKKLLAGAAAATILTVGSGAALAAQQAPQTTADSTKQAEQQEPSIKGSVQAPGGAGQDEAQKGKEGPEQNDAVEAQQEKTEAQQLRSLAKIDQAQAKQAALKAVPGTVKKAELGNENGYVVWDVEVAGQNGTLQDVKVDAGNGQVLAHETGDSEQGGANEANETGETAGR